MATQVKFYSVGSLPTGSANNAAGVYFVDGGELYKGASRFGLGRVTQVADVDAMNAQTGAARGDITVCAEGGAFAYTGSEWIAIGPDIGALQSSWQADISTWTAGLVAGASASGDTSKIITGITQDSDGKVTAIAEDFPELTTGDADGQVKLNGTNATISGWSDLTAVVDYSADGGAVVSAKDGYFTNLTASTATFNATTVTAGALTVNGDADINGTLTASVLSVPTISATTVTAETGNFTNLNVSGVASFVATTVSADTLTVGGKTIETIADERIAAIAEASASATDDGFSVTVVTQSGSVKSVSLVAPITATVASSTSTDIPTEGAVKTYVDNKLENINNIMDFVGVVGELPAAADSQAGDVVVIGADPTGEGLVAGQEYVFTGDGGWELIGDQNTYAINAYSKDGSTVMSGVSTVPGALDALANAVDAFTVASATEDDTAKGVTVSVTTEGGIVTDVSLSVVAASTMAFGAAGSGDELATTSAVADYFENNLVWLTASGTAVG